MDEKICVRGSPIHGDGVFAKEFIAEGDAIGHYEGDETEENGTHVLWVIDEEDNAVGIDQISEKLGLPAINALSNGVALGDFVADVLEQRQ